MLWAEPISEQLEINEDGKSVTRSEVRLDPGIFSTSNKSLFSSTDQERDNSIVLADGITPRGDNFLKSSNTLGEDKVSSAKSQDLMTPSNRVPFFIFFFFY